MSKKVVFFTRHRLAAAHTKIIVRPQRLILHWLVDTEVVADVLIVGELPIPMHEQGTLGADAQMSRTIIVLN